MAIRRIFSLCRLFHRCNKKRKMFCNEIASAIFKFERIHSFNEKVKNYFFPFIELANNLNRRKKKREIFLSTNTLGPRTLFCLVSHFVRVFKGTILGKFNPRFFHLLWFHWGMDSWDEFYIKIFSGNSADWIFKVRVRCTLKSFLLRSCPCTAQEDKQFDKD